MRWFAPAALCLLLAGCFFSPKPLFAPADGACPVDQPAIFTYGQIDAGGAIAKRHAFRLVPDGPYCRHEPIIGDDPPSRELFIPLEPGWRIVQRQDGESESAAYALARLRGGAIAYYQPQCDDFTAAALAEIGVELSTEKPDSNTQCTVTDPDQIRTLFSAWIKLGRAPSEFGVNEALQTE